MTKLEIFFKWRFLLSAATNSQVSRAVVVDSVLTGRISEQNCTRNLAIMMVPQSLACMGEIASRAKFWHGLRLVLAAAVG